MNDNEPLDWDERPDWAERVTTIVFAATVILIILMFGFYIGIGAP